MNKPKRRARQMAVEVTAALRLRTRKKPAKELTTVNAEPEKLGQLRILSERTRVSMQAYIREGIDFVLERYREHLK
jgi:Ribbon-helix-helix domain